MRSCGSDEVEVLHESGFAVPIPCLLCNAVKPAACTVLTRSTMHRKPNYCRRPAAFRARCDLRASPSPMILFARRDAGDGSNDMRTPRGVCIAATSFAADEPETTVELYPTANAPPIPFGAPVTDQR